MDGIILTDEALDTFKGLLDMPEPIEICDPSGKVLGRFTRVGSNASNHSDSPTRDEVPGHRLGEPERTKAAEN
jgi:hypothetical protein